MNQSLLKCEGINERLQGRAGRARTARSIYLTVYFGFVEVGRTNLGEHVHCAYIDQKYRGVFDAAIAIACYVIGDSSLNRLLLFQIERADDLIAPVRSFEHLLNKMRREKFSFRLHPRPKLTHRQFCLAIGSGPIVPIGLRDIDRMIVAIGKQRASAWALRDHAECRSEEHTSELQSQSNLVCRLLLDK